MITGRYLNRSTLRAIYNKMHSKMEIIKKAGKTQIWIGHVSVIYDVWHLQNPVIIDIRYFFNNEYRQDYHSIALRPFMRQTLDQM